MRDDADSEDRAPTRAQIAGGLLEGQAKGVERAGESMLHHARPVTRFLLKKIPGAPAMVFNMAQFATAPNKTRAAFGLAGGGLGGLAGGALGAAAGGVNAPIGAAVGSTFGETIGEQIYDEHAAAIDNAVDETKAWMTQRWDHLRNPGASPRPAPAAAHR